MSGQLDTLRKQIRALPYAEMMQLASEIVGIIDTVEAQAIADALVSVAEMSGSSEQQKSEEKILREIFKKKTHALSLQRSGTGWQLSVNAMPNMSTSAIDLRSLWPQLLDQAITLHLLMKR